MKKLLKRTVTVVTICAMLACCMLTLAGCSKSDKYKIGILMYSYDDIQGQEIKAYGSYLETGFDVEFVYQTIGYDDNGHINALESCISQGCDAVFSAYDTATDRCVEICEEAGVYYGLMLADSTSTNISASTLSNQYYLGGVKQFSGDPAATGEILVEILNQLPYSKIACMSFSASDYRDAVTIIKTIEDNLADGKELIYDGTKNFFEFNVTNTASVVTSMFSAQPDIEVVVGLSSGIDGVLTAMRGVTAASNAKLLAFGYTDEVKGYLEETDGMLVSAGNNNQVQCMASLFARAYDALASKGEASYADRGAEVDGVADYVILKTVEDVDNYKQYVLCTDGDKSGGPVSNEELKECMLSFNENATWASLNALTSRTLGDIVAVRSGS